LLCAIVLPFLSAAEPGRIGKKVLLNLDALFNPLKAQKIRCGIDKATPADAFFLKCLYFSARQAMAARFAARASMLKR
jgi:hypothetical protein